METSVKDKTLSDCKDSAPIIIPY